MKMSVMRYMSVDEDQYGKIYTENEREKNYK